MARQLSFRTKLLAGVSTLVVLAGGLLAYQILHREPPSFRRGGVFATGGPTTTTESSTATSTASQAAAPEGSTSTTASRSPATSGPPVTAATTATTRRRTAASTAKTTGPPAPAAPAPTSPPSTTPPTSAGAKAPPPAPPPAPAGPRLPQLGTYTYAVDGEESVSFFGSRRFPKEMTTVVHAGQGLAPNQLVFDLSYSRDHEEREIVSYRDDGIYFDFEGGSVTFGPRTETNEGDYEPPLLQVPATLEAGYTRSGTSAVRSSNGSVSRTEDWTVTVVDKETVTVAGAPVETWKIETERKSRPGSSEVSNRSRTYWYDPARVMWVRFIDVLHGERRTGGFTFTYDSRVTADLLRFAPS